MRPAWVLLIAGGCRTDVRWPGGTGVGNPGTTKIQTAPASGASFRDGSATVAAFTIRRCDGSPADRFPIGDTIDLLDSDAYPLAAGDWCELDVAFDPPLTWDGAAGTGSTAGTFELTLGVSRIAVPFEPGIVVDGESFVLQLGHRGWVSASGLGGLYDGTHTVVGEGHPAYDRSVSAIVNGSALFLDADGDGELSSDEERDPVSVGSSWSQGDE